MENQYQNIPTSGFSVLEQAVERTRLIVEAFTAGIITLSTFSIIQILEGAEHLPEVKDEGRSMIAKSIFKVYVKLNSAFRKIQISQNVPESIPFTIDRAELLVMIKMLKARMTHCEFERDQRVMVKDAEGNEVPKFNQDTYIGQKLLLLELLSLAMGTVVE